MPVIGRKKVYLPNFTVALLRTPHLPPSFAQFQVPLNINKLDLRDYLLHAYNTKVQSIRSFIVQQPIKTHKPNQNQRVRYYRPRSIKKMTVELQQPFVYPEEPKDLSAWDKELYEALEKAREANSKRTGPEAFKQPVPGRRHMRELAEKVLSGEIGREVEVEVEKDIKLEEEPR